MCRLLKCTTCKKVLDSKSQLKHHSKMHSGILKVVRLEPNEKDVISSNSRLPSITMLDVQMNTDSSVSEKVLMDAVAERKSMDRVDVSTHIFSSLFKIFLYFYQMAFDRSGKHGEERDKRIYEQMQVLSENLPKAKRSY